MKVKYIVGIIAIIVIGVGGASYLMTNHLINKNVASNQVSQNSVSSQTSPNEQNDNQVSTSNNSSNTNQESQTSSQEGQGKQSNTTISNTVHTNATDSVTQHINSNNNNNNNRNTSQNISSNTQVKKVNQGTSDSNSVIGKTAYVTGIEPGQAPQYAGSIGGGMYMYTSATNGQVVTIIGEKGNQYIVKVKQFEDSVNYIDKKYITFTNNQNDIYPNNNDMVSKYFGTWTVGKSIGNTIGESGKFASYTGDKLVVTADKFSFKGTTINNPNYYVISEFPNDYFGNSKYDNFGSIQLNKYGQMYDVVVLSSNERITNKEAFDKIICEEPNENSGNFIISGDSLVTYGGGLGNTSINICNRD